MKKYSAIFASLSVALILSGCGASKESAYKKAYEKAKAQEQSQNNAQTEAPVVTPIVEKPVSQSTVIDNSDNAAVRTENVTVVSGPGLQAFSVVVGSFSLKANAEGLQNTLKQAGYDAQIAYNSSRNMYRVIATTFADKASAVQSRNQFRAGNYPDAWLLFKN
ncbi:MAG: SPOR domain-containing protein [Prevotella sp.]|nr:SPOR domain-containing protein [Prevotella sp.]MDY4037901.1 SPOR domain-containing protein [Prevotella sp.]